MFTGLIEAVGNLSARETRGGDARLRIAMGTLPRGSADPVALGESISVNGVCLTVAAFDDAHFEADASRETLSLTTLGTLPVGRALNLERAMRADDRLGGHLVSGHVDGIGRLRSTGEDGLSRLFAFEAPAPLRRYLAAKGSITIDGTSLTVNAVDGDGFTVNLIPHTLAHTTLGALAPGDAVNLEVDQVARYVERLLAWRDAAPAP